MNQAFWHDVEETGYRLYELAVQDDSGIDWKKWIPANICQDSYSVTKAYTVTAVGLLWDRGLIDLNEPILPVLRSCGDYHAASGWEKVTVHHCLTHTMGTDEDILDIDTLDAGQFPNRDYLGYMLSRPLSHEPGFYRYTDGAFYLLSRVAAVKAGMGCDQLLSPMMYETMRYREAAWSRCPQGYPIGATGLYIAARDMVKLGWLYANGGVYDGTRVLSKDWTELVMRQEYEFGKLSGGWYGKGGMNGQMLMFNPEKRMSVAWHGFEPKGERKLVERICAL